MPLDATYDVTRPIGKVRLLISDTDLAAPVFADVEVQTFLDMNDGDVMLAAAEALDTIATNEALVLKVISSQDLQTDGAKLSAELRARADSLRARALQAADDGGFATVAQTRPRVELVEHTLTDPQEWWESQRDGGGYW